MSKRRMLNQDYYKLDAKQMRKTISARSQTEYFKVLEIKAKAKRQAK